jgi:hypothetical protein
MYFLCRVGVGCILSFIYFFFGLDMSRITEYMWAVFVTFILVDMNYILIGKL